MTRGVPKRGLRVVTDEDRIEGIDNCGMALRCAVDALRDRVLHEWEPMELHVARTEDRGWMYHARYIRDVPLQRGER